MLQRHTLHDRKEGLLLLFLHIRTSASVAIKSTTASPLPRPDPHSQQPEQPLPFQHQPIVVTKEMPVTDAAFPVPAGSGGGGPLGFPKATFSPALKAVEIGSFTLASTKTGRQWRAINAVRASQFGQVFRAVELMNNAGAPPAYFAIKVRVYQASALRVDVIVACSRGLRA